MKRPILLRLALPLVALSVSLGMPVLADTPLPVKKIVAELRQKKTTVPILVPNAFPGQERVYPYVEVDSQGYYLSFDLIPACQGATACRIANLEVRRGESLYKQADSQPIQLANNIRGTYTLIRGPYLTALVQWQRQGVLYKAAVKNGTKASAIALANAAIRGGIR